MLWRPPVGWGSAKLGPFASGSLRTPMTRTSLVCWMRCNGSSASRARGGNTMAVSDSGTFQLGGDLPVHRLGFGAMRITGEGIWGPPADHDDAIRVLSRAIAARGT